jgi:hypothetical protein
MLSFRSGNAIAQILGGKYDGKIIKIKNKDQEKCCDKCKGSCLTCCKNCVKKCCKTTDKISKKDPLYYIKKSLTKQIEGEYREITIKDGSIQVLPNINKRECLYIAGPSGSGKSTYASAYMEMYKLMYPKRKLYIFSRVEKDETLDKLKPIRIKLDEELKNDPINPEELKCSCVLFDDIDTIREKDIAKAVKDLRTDLLETGRHEDVNVISTSHQITNYKDTRVLLNEATAITFFPSSGSTYHITRFLKMYCGLDKRNIERALRLPSRWVTIYKTYPQYVVYEKGVYLI